MDIKAGGGLVFFILAVQDCFFFFLSGVDTSLVTAEGIYHTQFSTTTRRRDNDGSRLLSCKALDRRMIAWLPVYKDDRWGLLGFRM